MLNVGIWPVLCANVRESAAEAVFGCFAPLQRLQTVTKAGEAKARPLANHMQGEGGGARRHGRGPPGAHARQHAACQGLPPHAIRRYPMTTANCVRMMWRKGVARGRFRIDWVGCQRPLPVPRRTRLRSAARGDAGTVPPRPPRPRCPRGPQLGMASRQPCPLPTPCKGTCRALHRRASPWPPPTRVSRSNRQWPGHVSCNHGSRARVTGAPYVDPAAQCGPWCMGLRLPPTCPCPDPGGWACGSGRRS